MNFITTKKQSVVIVLLSFIIVTFSVFYSNPSFSQKTLTTSQDELKSLLAIHKGKVIYIDFWASWCGPCRKSFPWMNKIQSTYNPENFTVISINVDNDIALAQAFLHSLPANFPVVYDPKGELAKKYKIKGMPSSYLINTHGEIVQLHTGFFSKKIKLYEQEITQLLRLTTNNKLTKNNL